MYKRWIMVVAIIGIILIGGVLVEPIMSNVEIPNYEVLAKQEQIEVRQYDPMIIAEVTVDGNREDATGDGFRLLADYIFGNNTVQQKIAMTAPVEQQSSQKIAMTAPVQQQVKQGAWRISFVMPSEFTMESLPSPNNDKVVLAKVPSKQFVVITFSGTNSQANIDTHQAQLLEYVEANKLSITGVPKYAFYNPPWTLPIMRRNEIMFEIVP